MGDLRDKIARAMIAETILKALVFTSENSKAWADGLARDIAAVLDLDKVRAVAQVEALEDLASAHYLDGPQSIYDTIMRRADRIAREAGIETGG